MGLPVGIYIGKKMGLKNGIAKDAVVGASVMVVAWGLLRSRSWQSNGSIISVVASSVLFVGGVHVVLNRIA